MEQMPKKVNPSRIIHVVLAHSYLVYFFAMLLGLALEVSFPFTFSFQGFPGLGLILLVVGPLLIYWAQYTTGMSVQERATGKFDWTNFYQGPYKLTRSPTHIGIWFMMLGLSFIFNSLWLVLAVTLAFFVTRYVFISREEKILLEKYGEVYRTYQQKVRF